MTAGLPDCQSSAQDVCVCAGVRLCVSVCVFERESSKMRMEEDRVESVMHSLTASSYCPVTRGNRVNLSHAQACTFTSNRTHTHLDLQS